jgi:DNA-binding transcriptional LysR family regulator
MPVRYTLRQLEYFVAVGEYGSIAAASEKVNVSSPSISAAISQLEDEFGLPLFVRKHAQGLSLTKAGHRLMNQSQVILREADLLTSIAGDISGNVQGPMSIGCLLTFAQMILPKLRREFEIAYPSVRVSQSELTQTEIFSQIRKAELDVALTYNLDIPSDLDFQPLVDLPPHVLVNEDHPLARRDTVTVEDLAEHPMVLLDLPLSSDYFLSFFIQAGVRPRIAERTRDMAVMRSMVANGFGYSIANVRPLTDMSPDGGRLVFIPLTGNVRPMKMGLLMARGADANSTVKAFVDHCRKQITEDYVPGMIMKAAPAR